MQQAQLDKSVSHANEIVERFYDFKRWKHSGILVSHNEELCALSIKSYLCAKREDATTLRAVANAAFLLGFEAGREDVKLDIWRE